MNNILELRKQYKKINRMKEESQNDYMIKIHEYQKLWSQFKTPLSKDDERLINLIKNRISVLQHKINIPMIKSDKIDYTKDISFFKNKLISNNYFKNKLMLTIFYCSQLFYSEKNIDTYLKIWLKESYSFGLSPSEILDKNNRTIAQLDTININDYKEKNVNYYNYMSYFLTQLARKRGFLIKHFISEYTKLHSSEKIKEELYELLKFSKFIKQENLNSYVNAYYLLFINDDIETCLQKLSPLLENSIKYLCSSNEINPYKIEKLKNKKDAFVEGSNMLGFLLSRNKIKKILGPDVYFNIKFLFCNDYGINIRNNISHGIWDTDDYHDYVNYYAAIYILWLCVGYK